MLAPLFGGLAGAGWAAARAGSLLGPLIAMPLFAALSLTVWAIGSGAPGHHYFQAFFFGTIAVGPASAALGLVRGLRDPGD